MAAPRSIRRRGFTLIEVTLVVFIIGLMAGVAMIAFDSLTHQNLKKSARTLSTAIKVLFAQSVQDRAVYRLKYDLGTGEYYVQSRLVSGNNVEWKDCGCVSGFEKKRKLPANVRFKEISTMHDENAIKKGNTFSVLTGTGFIEPTVLHLIDDDKRELTLQVMPMTGAVRVFDGYVKFKK